MSDLLAHRTTQHLFQIILVAALYFLVAKAGLAFASVHPSASPVWPPSGVALAALLLAGLRLWPAIFIGAFFANVVTYGSTLTALVIAGGNTLEAVATTWLLMQWCGGVRTFDTPLQVAKFALLCLTSGTLLSPTAGVGSLTLAGYADPNDAGRIWLTWWLGDVGGQLLITPLIVLWASAGSDAFKSNALRRSSALVVVTAVVGFVAFGPLFAGTPLQIPVAFLAIIPLLWAALRYTQRDTATAAFVLCSFAIWGTVRHGGPLVGATLNDTFILVLTFVASTVLPSLILSTEVTVRRAVEQRQALLFAEMQHRLKNSLAILQAVAYRTLTSASHEDREAFVERIHALARAHDLLTIEEWNRASVREVVDKALEPFQEQQHERFSISGPQAYLEARQALLLGMALHELATNAAKYGALSNESGRVQLTWELNSQSDACCLNLLWQEDGGPQVASPRHKGFGSLLIEQGFAGEHARSSLEFAAGGLRWTLDLPIELAKTTTRAPT